VQVQVQVHEVQVLVQVQVVQVRLCALAGYIYIDHLYWLTRVVYIGCEAKTQSKVVCTDSFLVD
jgi:hypothetical protein